MSSPSPQSDTSELINNETKHTEAESSEKQGNLRTPSSSELPLVIEHFGPHLTSSINTGDSALVAKEGPGLADAMGEPETSSKAEASISSFSGAKTVEANGDDGLISTMNLELDLDGAIGSERSSSSVEIEFGREPADEQRRVKVYELIDNKWTDKGTAFCQSAYDEEKQLAKLIARSEENPHEVILQFHIRGHVVYQRQQETLIVWTEADGTDYALSFQDIEGCSDVWDYILDVQRAINGDRERDENDDPSSSSSPTNGRPVTFATIVQASHLPPPQLGIMQEVDRAIKHVGRNANHRDRLCEHIIATDYVRLMIELASQAEDLEQLDDLHALCGCMQTILLLNDHTVFDYATADDIFLGVCGMLEYDPEFPTHKACYRDILSLQTRFKQPVAFNDENIQRKINQTYRLQFLKDVVLTRIMEDSTFNVLNSCIIFNQIDLINHFQTDESFLRRIVGLFTDRRDPDTTNVALVDHDSEVPSSHEISSNAAGGEEDQRRKDVIFLIQQLCVMGKNVQLQVRLLLFRSLVDRGFVHAVQWGLSQQDATVMSASAEILGVLLEHDTNGVRAHVMRQAEAEDSAESIAHVLSNALVSGRGDMSLKSQLADCLKSLLETQPPDGPDAAIPGIKALIRQREDPITEKFLEYIYSRGCVKVMFKALADIPDHKTSMDHPLFLSAEKSMLYFNATELLCSMVQQHGFRSSHFILDSAISSRIASLLTSREKHIRLVGMRYFRACVKLNNRNVLNHLIKQDVLLPIIDLTVRESVRDNLLSSTCQEFFEHIRRENHKDLIHHVMTQHETKIRSLASSKIVGTRFQNFIRRFEQNVEPPPQAFDDKRRSEISVTQQWMQGRGMELEEEDWFNGSDDDDLPSSQPPWAHQGSSSRSPLKRKRSMMHTNVLSEWPTRRKLPPSPTPVNSPQSSGLVDYNDDDDPISAAVPPDSGPKSPGVNLSPVEVAIATPVVENLLRLQQPQPIKLPRLEAPQDMLGTVSHAAKRRNGLSDSAAMQDEPPRRTEKRRREDGDDDEEMLERLSSRSKRPDPSEQQATEGKEPPGSKASVKESGVKKKIRVSLGSIGRGLVSSVSKRTLGDGVTDEGG